MLGRLLSTQLAGSPPDSEARLGVRDLLLSHVPWCADLLARPHTEDRSVQGSNPEGAGTSFPRGVASPSHTQQAAGADG